VRMRERLRVCIVFRKTKQKTIGVVTRRYATFYVALTLNSPTVARLVDQGMLV
jgi:hypothetical protein